MYKKLICFTLLTLFYLGITSCGTLQSVKRGLTGEKINSVDEFLIEKKDPLVLPPDFENLPSPDERTVAAEENEIFQNTLESEEGYSSSENSTLENAILKKIKKNK
jgi:hypothetical protein